MSDATPTPVSKSKTWVALAGSLLAFIVPLALSVSDSLPAPWPAVIGAVVAVLTAVGVYQAPYLNPGTVVVPDEAVTPNPAPPKRGWTNPWR